jgi:hypothetical protein
MGYDILYYFLFVFYEVIIVSWPESRVLRVSQVDLGFFFNWIFFFQFYPILDWLNIEFYNSFWFVVYWVIPVFWLEFGRLTEVELTYVFVFFFYFFSI